MNVILIIGFLAFFFLRFLRIEFCNIQIKKKCFFLIVCNLPFSYRPTTKNGFILHYCFKIFFHLPLKNGYILPKRLCNSYKKWLPLFDHKKVAATFWPQKSGCHFLAIKSGCHNCNSYKKWLLLFDHKKVVATFWLQKSGCHFFFFFLIKHGCHFLTTKKWMVKKLILDSGIRLREIKCLPHFCSWLYTIRYTFVHNCTRPITFCWIM